MEANGLQCNVLLGFIDESKATTWRDLPDHLLEAIGSHVYGNDYLTARLVCHVWRRALSPVTRTVKVHLHHRLLNPGARLRAVQEAFPRACRVAIYVDANTERDGVDLTAACCATLNAMASTTAPDSLAHQSSQPQLPESKQQQLEKNTGNAMAWEGGATADPDLPTVDFNVESCGSNGGCPGPPDASGSGVSVDTPYGSRASDNEDIGPVGGGKLMWQFMSVTVGSSVLPLNRDQLDPTTHRLMSSCQWVGQQLGAAFAASRPALRCLRHLTTMELTSDTALFAALLPHLARTGSAPSLTELRFTRSEASRGSLGRWLAGAGPPAGGAGQRGSGEEIAAALDALGALTGLRSLALNAGLPGIPTSVSRLLHLSSLELHHSGRGVAMVEDVAPLALLTGLTSLKLRYVALRHTWQLTRFTALTSLDLTLRAIYSSEGGADGEEELDDLDDLDAVMEDDWFAPPAPEAGNNEGQVAAAAAAAAVPGGPAADGIAPVAIGPAALPLQQLPHLEFILQPAHLLQHPPQLHPQYGLMLPHPLLPAGAVGVQPPLHLVPLHLHVPAQIPAAAQGPSEGLPRQDATAQPQQPSHQPADQAGSAGSGLVTAEPGASLHPHVPVSWLNPNLALLLHPHLPRPQNHNPNYGPDQLQLQQQQGTAQPEQPDQLQQEPQHQQEEHPSKVSLHIPQQQGRSALQQCRCSGRDYRQNDQQGPFGAMPLEAIRSGDLLQLQLSTGTGASGSDGISFPAFCNTASCTTPTVAVTSALMPRASTFTTSTQVAQNIMQLAPQDAVGPTVYGRNDGSDAVNSMVVTHVKPAQEPSIGRVAGASGGDDVSGRRPDCSHGGTDVVARNAGGSAKHHGGFGSWMFGDSGRESDSDGAITFSLASSAAGSDGFVEDDGGGSGSIAGASGERQSRRVGADDGRITFPTISTGDGTAGGGGGGYGNGGVSTGLVLRLEPSVHSAPSAREGLACSASLSSTIAQDAELVPASHVLAPSVALSAVISEAVPEGAACEPCIASSPVQLPVSAGPFGSSWGSRSSSSSSCGGSGSGDGVVAAGLGPVGVTEVPHTSQQADGAYATSDRVGSDSVVVSDAAAQNLKIGQLDTVSTATPLIPLHGPEPLHTITMDDQAGARGILEIAAPVAAAAAVAANVANVAAAAAAAAVNAANAAAAAAAAAFAEFAGGDPGEGENGGHGAQAVGNAQLEEWFPGGADADGEEAEDEDDANGDDELAEAELVLAAAHDAAVSRELWRAVAALPGLKALNVNAWHEAPLDDERLGELAKLSLPSTAQLPVPGLTSLGLLLQASSASSRLSSLSDLTGLKDLTLVVAPPKGNGGRQPPPAAATVHLSTLDFEYDSEDELNQRPSDLAPSAAGVGGVGPSSLPQYNAAIATCPDFGTTPIAKLTVLADSSSPSLPVLPSRMECAAVGAVDADVDVQMAEPSGGSERNSNLKSGVGHRTADAGASSRCDGSAPAAAAASGSGGGDGIVSVGDIASPAAAAAVAGTCSSPVCHLAALTFLERLRLYDDPGALPVDQESAKLLSRAWSRMNDIYILGSITLQRSGSLTFGRLAHLDLFNQTSGVPYRLQLHHLPHSMRALGVQNAVLEGANRASQLQSVLEGLSLYATVHWPTRANGGIDMYDWIAGCSKLASLTIEYDMRTFANIMNGTAAAAGTGAAITDTIDAMETSAGGEAPRAAAATLGSCAAATASRPGLGLSALPLAAGTAGECFPLAHTPLRRLASLPALATLGVFFADSHQELMAGVLDQRLVDDVAELAFLEELEVWNVYGTDWNFQTDFSPFGRLSRLRSLKMEALPPFMAFRIRRTLQEGVPYCKLRLVADNEMVPVGPPAIAAGGLQAMHQQQAAGAAAAAAAVGGAMVGGGDGEGGAPGEAVDAGPPPFAIFGPLGINAPVFHGQQHLHQQMQDQQLQQLQQHLENLQHFQQGVQQHQNQDEGQQQQLQQERQRHE